MDIRSLYQKGVEKFDVGAPALKILNRLVAGDENSQDFENAILDDAFFTEQIILEGARLLKSGPVKSLSHAVSLIGSQRATYFILGHSMSRNFNSQSDKEFKDIATTGKKIKRAQEAESLAKSLECPFAGAAFAAGFIFDIFEEWLNSNSQIKENFSNLFSKTWLHGLRTATLAWSFNSNKKMDLPLQKLLFGSGLIHDIGKLLLAFSFPENYNGILLKQAHFKTRYPYDDAFEVTLEQDIFRYSHPEAGSLLLWQNEVLKDWEAAVEYHHDFGFLEVRDKRLNQIEICLRVADQIASLLETTDQVPEAIAQEIIEPYARFFPISPREIKDLVVTLRANRTLL